MESKPVIVTNHACERLLQRFRLFMRKHEQERPREFLLSDFATAKRDRILEQYPFQKAKLTEIYGVGAFFAHSVNLTYLCKDEDGGIVIRSVIKRRADWDPLKQAF